MKINYLIFSVLLFIFFDVNFSIAQHLDFENLSFVKVKNGISKKPISSIVEDKSGFIWIATQGDGIFRFDGSNYENFTYHFEGQNSFELPIVYCLYLDTKNQLWAGTNRGISLYNEDLNRFENVNFEKIGGIKGTIDVICLIENENHNIIIGTDYQGAYQMPLDASSISKIKVNTQIEEDFVFKSFSKSQQGTIYAGTNEGLFVLDSDIKIFKNQFSTEFNELITCSAFDANDNLWFGTLAGNIYKFDKKNNKPTLILSATTRRIFSLLFIDDYLMIGTELDGLMAYNLKNKNLHKYKANTLVENSLASMSIWQVYADSQKRLWIGSFEQGIQMVDQFNSKFNTIEYIPGDSSSLQGASIAGIQQDSEGKLWIGAPGGIDVYDPATKKIEHINKYQDSKFKGLTSTAILSVLLDQNDGVWVGTWDKGIFYLEKGASSFTNYTTNSSKNAIVTNSIFDFAEDSNGNIFIASFLKGIHYYNAKKKRIYYCNSAAFVETGLVKADSRVVFVDTADNIWVGTKTDLFKLTLKADDTFIVNRMTSQMKKDGAYLDVNPILSLFQSVDGTVWIGTNGNGLFSYNQDLNTFQEYTNFKDFNQTVINGITESKNGNIWVNGTLGLSQLNFKSNKASNYTSDDGLLSKYFNDNTLFTASDGTIYVGSFDGINYFKPEQLRINPKSPTVYLSKLKLFNKEVFPLTKDSPLNKELSQTTKIELNHQQSVFTIDYASINYTRPEKNTYAYRLKGFDKDWNYVGNTTSATYTNLNPGHYKFEVKGANNDGVWNNTPTSVAIIVIPPWWKTIWAKCTYFILGVLGLWIFFKFRISQIHIKTQKAYQNKLLMQLKLDEGRQIEKERISKELHDNLLGNIFGIRLGLDNTDGKNQHQLLSDRKKFVSKLSELEQEVRNISHGLSPNLSFSNQDFIQLVEQLLVDQCSAYPITYSLENDPNIIWATVHNDIKFNLYRVIQESILNIFKHANASTIAINFKKCSDKIHLQILDNGVGFKKEYTYGGIGLKNIKSRVQELGGSAYFENKKGYGAVIRVELPIDMKM